jgi:hypothetical protein
MTLDLYLKNVLIRQKKIQHINGKQQWHGE